MVISLLLSLNFAFAQSSVEAEGLQTGRYEIHKTAATEKDHEMPIIRKIKKKRKMASEGNALVTDSDGKKIETPSEVKEVAPTVQSAPVSPAPVEEKVQEPSLSTQAQSLASGNVQPIYDFYKEQVHPDDIRNNRVEIQVSPGIVSNTSKSNYSLRDYDSFFSVLDLNAGVWFTPMIGVSGSYAFSLAADISGDSSTRSRVAAHYEFLDLGLNFRSFFGLSRKSNSVEFNLLYSDDKMTVPSDNTARGGIHSSGFGLGALARIPTSAHYAWTLGAKFYPRLQHSETSTGINLNSGANPESVRFGLDLGGELKFSREGQLVWSLGASTEKNLFKDSASVADPETGSTPSGVSVTNTMVMFNLGYRWGQ